MTGWFIPFGLAILALGLVALLRPAAVRRLLGMSDSEPATYALRIAGMMTAAFGLLLSGFAIAYRLSEPAVVNSLGAS
jgi:uncharacterized protein YjeT (DUF2065 family)